jgi:hypothetical protein
MGIAIDRKIYDKLSPLQWDEKIFERSAQVKFPYQLKDLVDRMYPDKIARLTERLKEGRLDEEEAEFLNSKIKRLTEKYAVCKKMLSLRDTKAVPLTGEWEMHGTIYYIDFDSGDDGNTGLSTAQAWATLDKYTITTVRTAGDIAYVRAGTTYDGITGNINFDEDGSADSYISIIGCDSITNDPWGDASDVKPIVDFESNAYGVGISVDDRWILDGLKITGSSLAGSYGALYIRWTQYPGKINNCEIIENTGYGLKLDHIGHIELNDCIINDNRTYNLHAIMSTATINRTRIDDSDWGIRGETVNFLLNTCELGQVTPHSSGDIGLYYGGQLKMRNTKHNESYTALYYGYSVLSEDDQQVKGAHKSWYDNGTIEKKTDVTRTGGADSSALMTPNSSCGVNNPLSLSPFNEHDCSIYCPASEQTITIYVKANEAWSAYPIADQLFIEASYLSDGSSGERTKVQSTEVISDTDWTALTVTFTPAQAGFAYIKIYLGKYEAGKKIYVDPLPVVS